MQKLAATLLACTACAHTAAPRPDTSPVAIGAPAPAVDAPPAPTIHQAAREQMAQQRWGVAAAQLDAYLAREPADVAALFEAGWGGEAGWVAERGGESKLAAGFYQRALQREPAHAAAALNLSRLIDPAAGEAVLRGALQQKPENVQLLDALAAALRGQRKLDEAEALSRKVLERPPRDA